MSTNSKGAPPRALPARPSLRHLKAQAKDLLASGAATSVANAQFQVARQYGFASWPKLKAHIESLTFAKQATGDPATREALIGAIVTFLSSQDLLTREQIRAALEREIDLAGPAALMSLKARLAAGAEWDFYPADPLARRIHHVLADRLLREGSTLWGVEHATAMAGARVVIFSNHLSYADANLLEILLQRSGGAALADRLTTIAGPKVFTDRQRHFSSLCFGTIKTPQSTHLSTDEAVMGAREVVRAARRSIDVAHERLARGDALLVFGEGRRSRTRRLQPMLVGVARYLDGAGTWILPVGIVGTEDLFPIDEEALHPVRIEARIGRPIDATMLTACAGGNRRLIMDAVGLAIAQLLPSQYRGVYADDLEALRDASRVLSDAMHAS